MAYGHGLFVAVGYDGTIVTSSDGLTWAIKNQGTTNDLYAVTYSDSVSPSQPGQFVAVGYYGAVVTSPDGSAWTLTDLGHDKRSQCHSSYRQPFRPVRGRGRFRRDGDFL